ncbi:hypothetical protein MRX96_018716 [Rhipicephalus microplus]
MAGAQRQHSAVVGGGSRRTVKAVAMKFRAMVLFLRSQSRCSTREPNVGSVKKEVQFLGHKIDATSLHPLRDNLEAVTAARTPASARVPVEVSSRDAATVAVPTFEVAALSAVRATRSCQTTGTRFSGGVRPECGYGDGVHPSSSRVVYYADNVIQLEKSLRAVVRAASFLVFVLI